MNSDFELVKSILAEIKSDYISFCQYDLINENAPMTERDIVAEIYCRLKGFCNSKGLNVHCEIKPAYNEDANRIELKKLPVIDVIILSNKDGQTWISSAMKLQDKCSKGSIEARFSSIPVEFFHTAIEVKIQSKFDDTKKDIGKLKLVHDLNQECNCFFILLNARGKRSDHDRIQKCADENGICIFEHTCKLE
ncbi:MAG: hypothetical protein Q8R96_10750 [Bacteroidota bacterium]|nr:hypothetical protein [Bacteroidota bacterium]